MVCSSGNGYVMPLSNLDYEVTWSVTPNLTITSSQNITANIKYSGTQPGTGTITATVRRKIPLRLFVPTNNPQYGTVRVSVNNGCVASALTGITVFPGFCGSSPFTVAPNPATDEVVVQFEVGGDYEIVLLDKNGMEVSRATVKSDQFTLNVAKYPKGTYYLKVVGKDREGTERILIE